MKEYKTFMEGKVLEKRRNVVNHRTTEYQYGSAVRKLQSVPEIHTYEHERRIEEQEQERRQRRRENEELKDYAVRRKPIDAVRLRTAGTERE